jgi:hypothetical protein
MECIKTMQGLRDNFSTVIGSDFLLSYIKERKNLILILAMLLICSGILDDFLYDEKIFIWSLIILFLVFKYEEI